MAMSSLEHFAKLDAHAAQYAMITKSLLATAVEFLERREVQERLQRTESSAQLFGLIPHQTREADNSMSSIRKSPEMSRKLNNVSPGAIGNSSRDMGGGGGGGTHHNSESLMGDNNHPTGGTMGMGSPFFSDLDPAFLTMSSTLPHTPDLLMSGAFDGDESSFGGLNLFPLLETGGGGHIDLAHYL